MHGSTTCQQLCHAALIAAACGYELMGSRNLGMISLHSSAGKRSRRPACPSAAPVTSPAGRA